MQSSSIPLGTIPQFGGTHAQSLDIIINLSHKPED